MSELNKVIEDRLAAAEENASSAAAGAAAASTAAAAAQATADAANAKVSMGSSEPGSPTTGLIWADTGTPALKMWNGSAWVTFATV
ncbi:MAG TPA: hypothetical protein VKX17_02680 [Planctomycetota bacterium]|nr:hypothetical protein [Planctomycetota bacterium]